MDFGDIFHDLNLEGQYHGVQKSHHDIVPDAPVMSDIPDIFSLFESGDTLQELRASQWLPPSQHKVPLKDLTNSPIGHVYSDKDSSHKDNLAGPVISERGDSQEIYLGSQFPTVKKVKQSEPVPAVNHGLKLPQNKHVRQPVATPVKAAASHAGSEQKQSVSRMITPRFNRVTPQLREGTNIEDHVFETPAALIIPATRQRQGMHLRSVLEIPEQYRSIFKFQYFNIVQSKVFDDVIYTDRSLVVCSPTGSGKTAIFEMAIIRLLTNIGPFNRNFKVIYMAPIKALCSERYNDWREKFEPLGLKVMELTGDTDLEDFYLLQEVNVILTTPEKWDSMTRKWRDNKSIVQAIYLFLVDEIHILNDETRGATVEAVISRMKTIQAAKSRAKSNAGNPNSHDLRFVAASATLTNIDDIAAWLGTRKNPALHHKFDDKVRPVRLRKVVLGYNFNEKQSHFQFDITLNYKLAGIIKTYSENKPTLVFCSTRKSVTQAADMLAKDMKSSFIRSGQHRQNLQTLSFHIKDAKLRDLVMNGIGYHHAGMDFQDRKNVEEMFTNGELPVLVATSTLAMGVNLPAHLVIIKSTMYYNMGCHEDYSDTQILQMIGRAGRPQFDTSATAVIMTKHQTKDKYDNLINGTQLIESNLHKNLIEHLNAEIVLGTITDMSVAVEWLKSTFLYIRVMKNPRHYGIPTGLTQTSMEKRLQGGSNTLHNMCMTNLNQLLSLNLLKMNEDTLDVTPTDNGRLMARYCISYKTAKLFNSIKEEETIADLLAVISKCKEFEDIKLRVNERKTLNTLNKDKHRATIRFPLTGKIKTTDMKVNCLIQAQLGSLLVQDFALQQDTSRIFRVGTRIMRCLLEFLSPRENSHVSVLSALQLCKAFKARLWENSKFVSKQLDGIGPTLSNALVNAGLTTFEKIEQTNPREIELIVNRHPPFGNQVRDSALNLPKYELVMEQIARYSETTAELVVSLQITNRDHLNEKLTTSGHTCTLLIGDTDNNIVFKQRIMDSLLLKENTWSKRIDICVATNGPELNIHYISHDWVGLDIECTYTPIYIGSVRISNSSAPTKCESVGVKGKPKRKQTKNQTKSSKTKPKQTCTKGVANYLRDLREKASLYSNTPSLKRPRLQFAQDGNRRAAFDLTKYGYTPKPKYGDTLTDLYHQNETSNLDENEVYDAPCDTPYRPESQMQDSTMRMMDEPEMKKSVRKTEDWLELDQFIRHREICRMEEEHQYYQEVESLPDLETDHTAASSNMNPRTFDNIQMAPDVQDYNLAVPTSDIWSCNKNKPSMGGYNRMSASPYMQNNPTSATPNAPRNRMDSTGTCADKNEYSLVQETDYGCVYTGGDDPVLDWDDRVTEQLNGTICQPRHTEAISHLIRNGDEAHEVIECYESDDENQHSKWTSYFSSQSSTASDYLRSKCPVRYDTHHVDMQDSGPVTVQGNSSKVTGFQASRRFNDEHSKVNPTDGYRFISTKGKPTCNVESSRKYGQVLAWISNSQNEDCVPETDKHSNAESWSDDENFVDLCENDDTCENAGLNTGQLKGILKKPTYAVHKDINGKAKGCVMADVRNCEDAKENAGRHVTEQRRQKWSQFFSSNRSSETGVEFKSIFDGLF